MRLVRRERPAVVLLDLLMPDVDGFAVVERLRADPRVGDVPIVVLTSKDMTPPTASGCRPDQPPGPEGHFRPAELVDLVGGVGRRAASRPSEAP